MLWAIALLVSVTLSPPFGEAEVSTVRAGDDLELQVSVEVDVGALTVLARPITAEGTELPPTALVHTGEGVWRGLVTVPARSDIRMGFELISEAGSEATVSEVHTLIELGVDPAVFRGPDAAPTTTDVAADSEAATPSNRWGWLGLAAGAAALALLALWVVGMRRPGTDHGVGEPDGAEVDGLELDGEPAADARDDGAVIDTAPH